MSLFSHPLQFFSPQTAKKESIQTPADKVIIFVQGFVNRADLIQDIIKKYEESRYLPKEEQAFARVACYIALEAFIIKNKPLIVKQEFTKESLREEVAKRFDIQGLTSEFRLLFVPEKEESVLIFEQGVNELSAYMIKNIGKYSLNHALTLLQDDRAKQLFHVTDNGIQFDALDVSLQQLSITEVMGLFQELYKVLLVEISTSLGSHNMETITAAIFDTVRRTYDYDVIAKFMDVLPDGVLEGERIRSLGRDELENKVRSRTQELNEAKQQLEQKLALINKQNTELSQAQQALLNSLKEEKRLEEELKKEKELIEEKVKERTAELQHKTDELNKTMTQLQSSYKQTEDEKARLLASINSLSLGFAMTDSTDEIIAVNKIFYGILKVQNEEFSSIEQLQKFMGESVDLMTYYLKSKNEKTVQKVTDINLHNIFLRFFFTPIMINDNCIGVVILLEDISEAKLLERSKDEFFAVASHELRTPLTAIRGFTSLILDNFQEPLEKEPRLTSMINNIHDSSIRLIKIVNSFLDASKLEQGKVVFTMESFDLTVLLDSVVTELSPLAKEKNIELTLQKQEAIPPVYSDQEKIKQIAFNLIGNAIKFTEKGGVTVKIEPIDQSVKVLVIDTGLGVSEEYRQLLFRKFQQAGERILTKDAATGSGMGLYISKLLIEAMNGSITIEKTKLGEGSTFAFTIPIAKKQ